MNLLGAPASRRPVGRRKPELAGETPALPGSVPRFTSDTNQKVVNGVKGDPNFGDDSDLYDSMGYVRKSDRQSGLTRKKNAAQSAAKKQP